MLEEFIHQPRIAYFSMEIALRNEIPTYAGGLGVLAGDTMRSATDLELPMVAVSLMSHAGYFRQEIDARGRQLEHTEIWDPRRWAQSLDAKIAVQIDGRTVWISAWLYVLEGSMGGSQPVLLLDTDLNENNSAMWSELRDTGKWSGDIWDKRKNGVPEAALGGIIPAQGAGVLNPDNRAQFSRANKLSVFQFPINRAIS